MVCRRMGDFECRKPTACPFAFHHFKTCNRSVGRKRRARWLIVILCKSEDKWFVCVFDWSHSTLIRLKICTRTHKQTGKSFWHGVARLFRNDGYGNDNDDQKYNGWWHLANAIGKEALCLRTCVLRGASWATIILVTKVIKLRLTFMWAPLLALPLWRIESLDTIFYWTGNPFHLQMKSHMDQSAHCASKKSQEKNGRMIQ